MFPWLIAVAAAAALAAVQYFRAGRRAILPALLRFGALVLVAALALDAPARRARPPRPIVAIDVSQSWLRAADAKVFARARDEAQKLAGDDTVWATGDSVRPLARLIPADTRSRLGRLPDRATASGRPLVVFTDGELEGAERIRELPGGSRLVAAAPGRRPDLAVMRLGAPEAVLAGDTIEMVVGLAAGAAGSPRTSLSLMLGDRIAGRERIDALGPGGERIARFRVVFSTPGYRTVSAALARADGERRNDTLAVTVVVRATPAVVWVSSAPDQDARFALAALRGALRLPVRAYFRIARGEWRIDGPLTRVSERAVRRALREASIAVVHGDTAIFGPPRRATTGRLALVPIARGDDDWYPVAVPSSPLASGLAGIPLESLPPLDVGTAPPRGEWEALTVARGRRLDHRPAIVGSERPRRTVIVDAAGLWRWKFRGGPSEAAFLAVWGAVFDWLADERREGLALAPTEQVLRAGDPVVWRGRAEEGMRVVIRQGRTMVAAPMVTGTDVGEVRTTLAPGRYVATVPGGRVPIVVNQSREWLPARARESFSVPLAPGARGVPLRDFVWPYAAAIVLLCLEWIARRRIGLR